MPWEHLFPPNQLPLLLSYAFYPLLPPTLVPTITYYPAYYTAYYPLHTIVSVPHAAASMNTTTWALITTRGVDTSDHFNFTEATHYDAHLTLFWLLDHVSYNIDLIKCVFTNKIKVSFSPSWHIPKRFNAWKILLDASPRTEGMHSNTIQYNAIQCISKERTEGMHLRGWPARPPSRIFAASGVQEMQGLAAGFFLFEYKYKIKYQYKYTHHISIQIHTSNINTNTQIKYQYKYKDHYFTILSRVVNDIYRPSFIQRYSERILQIFPIIKCVIFPLMRKSFPRRYVWKVNHSRKNLPMSGYILCIRFMVSTKICSLHILHTGIYIRAPCTYCAHWNMCTAPRYV